MADAPATPDAVPPEAKLGAKRETRLWLRLLWIPGVLFLAAQAILFGWAWSNDRGELPGMGYAIGALFLAGKEAAIPVLATSGSDIFLVAGSVLLTDLGVTLILYPLLHAAMDAAESRRGFVGGILRGARRHAAKRRRVVDRYGTFGLYLYAVIPFAFNGPPVVAVLGRLAGVRAERVVPIMVLAIVTTTIGWTLIAYYGIRELSFAHPLLPLALSFLVTAIAFGVVIYGAIQERRAEAAAKAEA